MTTPTLEQITTVMRARIETDGRFTPTNLYTLRNDVALEQIAIDVAGASTAGGICDALNAIVDAEIAARAARRKAEEDARLARRREATQRRIEEALRREHRCLRCHRILTDEVSIALGYGPECITHV